MRFTDEQIRFRRPIWDALSTLYLQNDFQLYDYVAGVCADSAFSLDELEKILFEEIHPILEPNLSIAGFEEYGFDQEWLTEKINNYHPKYVLSDFLLQKWIRRLVYPWKHLRKRIINRRALIKSPT